MCDSPTIVRRNYNYHDIKGYQYGLCKHSEDKGSEVECPSETTACGKISISMDKAKAEKLLEEVKNLLPDERERKRLDITRMKQGLLRERGSRPSEGI